MVIIPTEKRFDWQHAPLVLLAIVMVNVLVFMLYQTHDDRKFEQAFSVYQQNSLFELEWPAFEQYLKREGDAQLAEYQSLQRARQIDDLSMVLIMRDGFCDFVRDNHQDFMSYERYELWQSQREQINNFVASVSYIAHGLNPGHFTVSALLSHQFLHGDIMHLLGNMFFLIICGFAVEAAIGHRLFLLFYLLSGVAGGLLHMLLNLDSNAPLVGASGAISGVMAMYLAVFRLRKIEFFYWFFVFVGYFRAPALVILPFYVGKELFSFFSEPESGIAFMAHVGGFVMGGLLIAIALYVKPGIVNEEYVEEDQSVDPYRQQLARVYAAIEKFQFHHALTHVQTLIDEHGLNFELAMLRYNLTKVEQDERHQKHTIELLSLKQADGHELERLAGIWRENPAVQQLMGANALVSLAMVFANMPSPALAEEVFTKLSRDFPTAENMGVVARKLSLLYEKLRDTKKQQHYASLADGLAAGAR